MKLSSLLQKASLSKLLRDGALPDPDIVGISFNSNTIKTGELFVALPGATPTSRHGHEFVSDAMEKGASAILVGSDFRLENAPKEIPVLFSVDPRRDLALLAEAFFDFPSRKLALIGITGTNGKTSTTFMLHSIFSHAGLSCRVLGTLGMGEPHALSPLSHTTMDAIFLSKTLAGWADEGVTHVFMEVSSHALSLCRVDGLHFSAVGVLNLTQDHLDFHGDMAAYRTAKARLFELAGKDGKKFSVGNPLLLDDDGSVHFLGPGMSRFFTHVQVLLTGCTAYFNAPGEDAIFTKIPLPGEFHLNNALMAMSIAHGFGLSLETITEGLLGLSQIPGRAQMLRLPKTPTVIVDFAHTPDGLKLLLEWVRKSLSGKLIVVFGCGGDRDEKKRPLMGAVAASIADVIVVTDDNPRSEDPSVIRRMIIDGISSNVQSKILEIASRQDAIMQAISWAHPEDVVVVAGKGHENYQIYRHETRYFSDQEQALEALKNYETAYAQNSTVGIHLRPHHSIERA